MYWMLHLLILVNILRSATNLLVCIMLARVGDALQTMHWPRKAKYSFTVLPACRVLLQSLSGITSHRKYNLLSSYVMRHTSWTLTDSYQHVFKARGIIFPNDG